MPKNHFVSKKTLDFILAGFLTEYIQIDKLIIKKKKTIVKDTIEFPLTCCQSLFCMV